MTVLDLFRAGMDTSDIAIKLSLPESEVFEILTRQRAADLNRPSGFISHWPSSLAKFVTRPSPEGLLMTCNA